MGSQERILGIYSRLLHGETLIKAPLAEELDTAPKNVQRDIDIIQQFLDTTKSDLKIERPLRGYYKIDMPPELTDKDLQILIKVCHTKRATDELRRLGPKLESLLQARQRDPQYDQPQV